MKILYLNIFLLLLFGCISKKPIQLAPSSHEPQKKEGEILLKENLDIRNPSLHFGLILGFVVTSIILMKLSNKEGANSN